MIEDELKLAVHGLFTLPELTDDEHGLRVEPDGTRVLRATYWDTADLRLARNGVTLRHRTGEDGPPWQLKLPVTGRGEGVREELAERGRPEEVPAALRSLVTGWARTAPLAPVATLRTSRAVHRVVDGDGKELAELVDDTVSVVEGRRVVARFRELEVERRAADDGVMTWLRDRLVDAGAVEGEFTPKVVRALGPMAAHGTDLPSPERPGRKAPAGEVVAASLADGVRRLITHDAPVRRGAHDAVHQMRVACRRLRSDLRTYGPLVDAEWAQGLRDELSWLADVLGAARDLEVLRERIRDAAESDPLAPVDPGAVARIDVLLAGREDVALAAVAEALDQPRYAALLERVVEAARHPALTPLASEPVEEALTPLVSAAWEKLASKAAKLTPTKADHTWHKVRILAKRARYAAEAAAPAIGKPAKRTGEAAASVQDLLGRHQDAVVATDALLEIAEANPSEWRLVLTCGRLAERERAEVREVRAAFGEVWRDASAPKVTRWLRG